MFKRIGWLGRVVSCAALACVLGTGVASAQRAGSSSILPRDTLAYVRVTNVPEFAQKFMKTGTGRMFQDPQMKPLVESLYGQASEALGEVKEKIGLSLDELLKIPAGEIAFAVIAVPNQSPAMALIIDTGANAANARKLLETIEPQVRNLQRREETIEGQKVVVFQTNGPEIFLFERDGTFVFCTVGETVAELIKNWNGRDKDSFNDNLRYGAVMTACRTKNADPNLVWYVEPIRLIRAALANNFQAQVGLAVLPALGLDGLQAVGGTLAFDVDEFDYLGHAHVLLDSPRAGVIEVIKPGHGDLKPLPWVPADVASYTTLYWEFRDSFNNLERLIDSFQGPGKTAEGIKQNISDKIEVDVITEILPLLAGRVTMITRMPKVANVLPAANVETIGTQVRVGAQFARQAEMVFAIDLTDMKRAEGILDRLLAKPDIGERVEKKSWAGHTYYAIAPREQRDLLPDAPPANRPCFALANDCLMIGTEPTFLQMTLGAREDKDMLANSLEYKLMSSKSLRQAGDGRVGMIGFQRPSETLKYYWDLAVAEQTRERMKQAGENNRFMAKLDEALTKNPLPPFASVEKYFSPTGSILVDTDNGFHYLTFTLKRKRD